MLKGGAVALTLTLAALAFLLLGEYWLPYWGLRYVFNTPQDPALREWGTFGESVRMYSKFEDKGAAYFSALLMYWPFFAFVPAAWWIAIRDRLALGSAAVGLVAALTALCVSYGMYMLLAMPSGATGGGGIAVSILAFWFGIPAGFLARWGYSAVRRIVDQRAEHVLGRALGRVAQQEHEKLKTMGRAERPRS